jgi:hypothetical protein
MIKTKRVAWTGHVARVGEMRNAYKPFVGIPEGKRTVATLASWEANIKIHVSDYDPLACSCDKE